MRIFIYGNDGRLAVCRRFLLSAYEKGELPSGVGDVHLLPIPSYRFSLSDFTGDLGGHSDGACAAEDLQKHRSAQEGVACSAIGAQGEKNKEASQREQDGAAVTRRPSVTPREQESESRATDGGTIDLIVGYGVHPSFFEFEGVRVLDLEADEPFLRRNARLTALGTVGTLLCEHTRALPELCVGVIGYGRIGRELVDILSFLETELVVFSANGRTREEFSTQKIRTVPIIWQGNDTQNINDCLQNEGITRVADILLNTSPAKFSAKFFDGYAGKIYDLASGEPIPQTVEYTRLASLPMRMYSESAGHAVYESVMTALYEIDREQIR